MLGLTISLTLSFAGISLFFYQIKKVSRLKFLNREEHSARLLLLSSLGIISCLFIGPIFFAIIMICIYVNDAGLKVYEQIYKIKMFKIKSIIIELFILFIKFWPFLFLSSLFSAFLLPDYPAQESIQELRSSNYSSQVKIIITALFIAPIVEELIFRKFLFVALIKKSGLLWASIISSFCFSLVHLNLSAFLVLFILGLFLSYSYLKFGTLIAPVICHFLFNLIMITSILSGH